MKRERVKPCSVSSHLIVKETQKRFYKIDIRFFMIL